MIKPPGVVTKGSVVLEFEARYPSAECFAAQSPGRQRAPRFPKCAACLTSCAKTVVRAGALGPSALSPGAWAPAGAAEEGRVASPPVSPPKFLTGALSTQGGVRVCGAPGPVDRFCRALPCAQHIAVARISQTRKQAQRGEATCPRMHRWEGAEPRLKPRPPGSRGLALTRVPTAQGQG